MEKRAFEQTGLVPRSIIRTFDRFRRQLLKGAETSVIQEFRVSRYQVLVSVKCLVSLLIIPLVVNFLAKTFFLMPLTEYLWNTQQNEIFLNLYQENRAFSELHDFEEKLFFESLIETQSVPALTFTPSEINNYTKSLLQPSKTFYNGKNNEIIDVITKDIKKLSKENNLQENLVLQPAPLITSPFPDILPLPPSNISFGNVREKVASNTFSESVKEKGCKADMPGERSQKIKLPFNDLAPCAYTEKRCWQITPDNPFRNVRSGVGKSPNILTPPTNITSGDVCPALTFLPLPLKGEKGEKEMLEGEKGISDINKANRKGNFVIPWSKKNQIQLTPSKSGLEHFKFEDKILHTSNFSKTNRLPINSVLLSVRDSKQIVFDNVKVNEEQAMSTFYLENSLPQKFQQKTIELAIYYNQQSIEAITNLFGDFITFITISFLFIWMEPQIIILKSFLTESLYSLSDTTKSFLLILLTDLLVGFHSPRGWEIFIELILRHFGLPENQDFIFLFVATFPVLLDTVFKYWIFRYLNQISPSTVATYHSMIE